MRLRQFRFCTYIVRSRIVLHLAGPDTAHHVDLHTSVGAQRGWARGERRDHRPREAAAGG